MITLKQKNIFMMSRSLYILILFNLMILPWGGYIYSDLLQGSLLYILLSYLGVYLVIYGIFLIFTLPRTFNITDSYVEKIYNFLFIHTRKVSYFNNSKISIRINSNFILSIFYLERISVFTIDERKLFSLYVEKDESINIINDCLKVKTEVKKPFKKNEDFFRDTKGIESYVYTSFLISVFITLIFNLIFGFFIDNIMRLIFIGFIVLFVSFIIIVFYNLTHSLNQISKVDNEYIHTMKGNIFKSNYYLPRSKLDDVIIIGGPFSNYLNTFTVMTFITKTRFVLIPMHKENIEIDLNIILDKKNKSYVNIPNIITYSIIALVLSIVISIFNIIGGISTLILLEFIVLVFNMGNYFVLDNERIISRTKFFIAFYRVMRFSLMKRIKLKRYYKGYRVIEYTLYDKKYNQIISLSDATEITKPIKK